MRRLLLALAAIFAFAAGDAAASPGHIIILNFDKPNTGFNDPTPVAPVGGNDGTTLGQQRLNVFLAAAAEWEKNIEVPLDIRVEATFAPIPGCNADSGVLGQAAPLEWTYNFPGAPAQNVWYPIALANRLAGVDLRPSMDDIFIQFNAAVDNATCLGSINWYYGLDGRKGDDTDLFVVVLHELAHGLGIAGPAGSPDFKDNRPSVADTHALDLSIGMRWDQMSQEQRLVSVTNSGNLVWDGQHVRDFADHFLQPGATLTISSPAPVARNYDIGNADFGPAPERSSVSGRLIQAADAANADGASTSDGCTAISNASALSGNIAVIDRGSCTFVTKARNAQAAGARAVVVVDNDREACSPPGMTGDAPDVTIPIVSIRARDGDAIRAQLTANVHVEGALHVDASQLAGTAGGSYVRLYAPCTLEPGSSTHHWDVVAWPNLLMEPNVSSDLLHGLDLTVYQLLDLGWTLLPRSGRTILRR